MTKKLRLITAIAVIFTAWACADDNIVELSGVDPIQEKAVLELGVLDENNSRLIYEGSVTKFATGDKIGVVGEAYNNLSFTVGEMNSRAYSDLPLTMEKDTKFFAYYPYSESVADFTKFPISIAETQTQADAEFTHVNEYDILISDETTVKKTTVAMFKHLGAWIDFVVYNREDADMIVNSVEIKSSAKSFVKSGTFNLTATTDNEEYLKINVAEYTDKITLNATGDWRTIAKNKKATFRTVILPSDLSNDTITITLNTNSGVITQKFIGRNFERGNIYQLTFNDKEIYLPGRNWWRPDGEESFNWRQADLYDDNSYFCYRRSKQSENLIVFWEAGFGDDPSKASGKYKVDVDAMLEDLETYYALYRDELKFVIPGYSLTDKYKMMIFLYYTDAWYAWGGDIDTQVGAFWVSPVVAQPATRAIAHELGHGFQGQVRADARYADPQLLHHGYTNAGFANDGLGTPFLECCANYMAWQNMDNFKTWECEIPVHQAQSHKGFTHEWCAYQYFFLLGYWEELHGRDFQGRMWRYTRRGEDPIEAYKRVTETSQEQFNDELWMSAAKEQTWSFHNETINGYMRSMVDKRNATDRKNYYTNKAWLIHNEADGYYRPYPDTYTVDKGTTVNYGMAPQSYGHNAIYLKVPVAGTEITIDFEGLKSYPETTLPAYRYDPNRNDNLGWRWGLVACTGEGGWTPVYSEVRKDSKGTMKFTVPEDTKRLFLIVSGAPIEHVRKPYNNGVNDDWEYPYRFKVTGTDVNTGYMKIEKENVEL